jgi:hypothetical protein
MAGQLRIAQVLAAGAAGAQLAQYAIELAHAISRHGISPAPWNVPLCAVAR